MITMSTLGYNGRFGNQLFQYCYAKALARKLNTTLQIPKNWIGRQIFNIDDEEIRVRLPQGRLDEGADNRDIVGYFQYGELEGGKYYLPYSKSDIKNWLVFKDSIIKKYAIHYKPFVYHIRRYNDDTRYANILPIAYIDEIREHNEDFEQIGIVDKNELLLQTEIDFLYDFFTLMYSKILYRSNSTFSWWAATLGDINHGLLTYSPVVEDRVGKIDNINFVLGNHPKMASSKYHSSKLTDLWIKQ